MNTDLNLSLMGQYFYNGFGGTTDGAALPEPEKPALANLLGYAGQHYAAASISLMELFTPKLSAALFGIYGFDTESGTANLLFSWRFFDELILNAGPTFAYGDDYTKDGKPTIGLQITARLGGGNF
jgi:hypothetical protein